MKSVKCQYTTHNAYNTNGFAFSLFTSSGNQGWSDVKITDMQGYRYPFGLEKICVPDGEYLLKPYLSSNYRIIKPNTEMAYILIEQDPSLKDYFAKNAENYEKGARFSVKNGICNDVIKFYAENVPTDKNAYTADIKVVDEETGENVEGVTAVMSSPNYSGNISWNTNDTPEIHLDYLRFWNDDYSFKLTNIPEGYAYKYEEPNISFTKYGEHQDLIIKLSKTTAKGDANCDGNIDMSDIVLIMQALANPNKYGINGTDSRRLTDQGSLNADVDTSTSGITGNDALLI